MSKGILYIYRGLNVQVHVPPGRDVEADVLEANVDSGDRDRREAYNYESSNITQTYDESTKMNHFEFTGSFTLQRVGEEQMLRTKRDAAVDHLELAEAVESTLLAFVNRSMCFNVYIILCLVFCNDTLSLNIRKVTFPRIC